MKKVLLLCTGNSCRSQMAEGLWNKFAAGTWRAFSAGIRPAGHVHPTAMRVMAEVGIDINKLRSKSVDEFRDAQFELVVTVCNGAKESCPVLPGSVQVLHWPIDDPAQATGTSDERLAVFRRVRDEISHQITAFLERDR